MTFRPLSQSGLRTRAATHAGQSDKEAGKRTGKHIRACYFHSRNVLQAESQTAINAGLRTSVLP